jgi:hypothetical protein
MTDMWQLVSTMELNGPGSKAALEQVGERLAVRFPADYVEFMLTANGGEGPIGEEGYLRLWPVEELEKMDVGYNIPEWAPELVLFGTDGGGAAYAFDRRPDGPARPVELPFEVLNIDAARPRGETFADFLQYVHDE